MRSSATITRLGAGAPRSARQRADRGASASVQLTSETIMSGTAGIPRIGMGGAWRLVQTDARQREVFTAFCRADVSSELRAAPAVHRQNLPRHEGGVHPEKE